MSFSIANIAFRYKRELVIFGVSFGVRALYDVAVQLFSGAHGFISFADAKAFYYQAALNLVHEHAFSIAVTAPFYPEAYHTPLYPAFIAALLAINVPLVGIVMVQALFCGLTTVLSYRIALMLSLSRIAALCVALLIALDPMSVFWSGLLMSDTLFAFFITLSIYLLLKERTGYSLMVLGLAALVRPMALYFMPVYLLMVIYLAFAKKRSVSDSLRKASISLLIFFAVIVPWSMRNYAVFGTVELSSAGWYLFHGFPLGEFSRTYGIPVVPVVTPDTGPDDYHRFDFAYGPLYKQAFFETAAQNPSGFLLVYLKRTMYGFFTDRYEYIFHGILDSQFPAIYERIPAFAVLFILGIGQMFWTVVYALSLLAGFEQRTRHWWLFFVALFGLNMALSAGINPSGLDMSRYTLPFHALLYGFASIGIAWLDARFAAYRGERKKV